MTSPAASGGSWKTYQRLGSIDARPYEHGDQALYVISISEADLKLPTLIGGMIARNPGNPDDQWYIAQDFFLKHYGPPASDATTSTLAEILTLVDDLSREKYSAGCSAGHPLGGLSARQQEREADETEAALKAAITAAFAREPQS